MTAFSSPRVYSPDELRGLLWRALSEGRPSLGGEERRRERKSE